MLLYSRNDERAPACLSDKRSRPGRDALLKLFSDKDPTVSQRRFSMRELEVQDPELQSALTRLFKGRCAFCETRTDTLPYRFRPTEEAGPSDMAPKGSANRSHLYYSWLTNSWSNIYSICRGCLPIEPTYFPVRGFRCHLPSLKRIEEYASETAGSWRGDVPEDIIFLDPCDDHEPRADIAPLPDGVFWALTRRGDQTIEHFHLNRSELVASRQKAFRQHADAMMSNADNPKELAGSFAFDDMEYGGAWYALLYHMGRSLARGSGRSISKLAIARFYKERIGRREFRERFEGLFRDLPDNPEQIQPKVAQVAKPGEARPTEFLIKNFKSIENLSVKIPQVTENVSAETREQLAPALVIIGENAAGKSSILEAMALALSGRRAREDLPDTDRFMLNPAYLGAPGQPQARRSELGVTYENGDTALAVIDYAGSPDRGTPPPVRIPVFAYGAFRIYMQTGKRRKPSSDIRSLFDPSYDLPNPERWLASLENKPIFHEVIRCIRSVIAIDQKFDTIEVDPGTGQCSMVLVTERPGQPPLTVRTPLRAVSSGFRSVLSMICDVLAGLIRIQGTRSASLARTRAVVLIDEIEAHLHPRWKMRIIQGLREALPNVTFILTTHDPLCLRGLSGNEVMVLRRFQRTAAKKDELPEVVERLEDLPAIGTLTVEQLLTSDLFQLFTTDAPNSETTLAEVGDLIAKELGDEALADVDAKRLKEVRAEIHAQIRTSIPIGSTEVERLIQEAVELYLVDRRTTRADNLKALRDDARAKILTALKQG